MATPAILFVLNGSLVKTVKFNCIHKRQIPNLHLLYVAPLLTPAMPWVRVPTARTTPVNPYTVQRRLLVPGVTNGTTLLPPPAYSAVPGSKFWNMAKDVYDKKNNATSD